MGKLHVTYSRGGVLICEKLDEIISLCIQIRNSRDFSEIGKAILTIKNLAEVAKEDGRNMERKLLEYKGTKL